MVVPRPAPMGTALLPPAVAGPLSALAGAPDRPPLIYTGDTASSLAALRQDIASSYRAICGALGEPVRSDLVSATPHTASALGLHMPLAARLPLLAGGSSLVPAPVRLPPVPPGQAAAPVSPTAGVATELGTSIGIEGVGSGGDAPARVLATGASRTGAGSRFPTGAVAGPRNPMMGALRSLSAGHAGMTAAPGLPPLAPGRQADGHWPMGRPAPGSFSSRGSGSGGIGDGPRVAMLSGLTRPQDPSSDFLGEESAVVYPPAGRSFGGGASSTAQAVLGTAGLGPGQMIDAMDDFRFRGGGNKHIKIEDLDDPSRLVPSFRRNDDMQLELFLKEYARDRSKPRPVQRGNSRFHMPF
ncbi:hypothetical protein VOLCADRAFT_105378 [Volvox carteri f. nagariensis]|uniref:Uncharacterized protein n=1 Tax=Volvox carteri f. nagariensis TaxID=3068 RepID=D8U0X8_VOLCA|nr:uncharacterized protein VOLCADRAFT_105378 [Volvox carteri f. nagariensis]EFJ46716.1 hypothetical protein VOLCADRAFT_105378 [Volvox carteri f. nagariensis]|eukprot:XP_002952245.1 hypothetical protein VOLCADRAFT_105378 [Volvox carteri f. nagariensis]